MSEFTEATEKSIRLELSTIWAAHHAVGLKGLMSLYTINAQDPWRSKQGGTVFWFAPQDMDAVIAEIKKNYNNGALPNSPLLLNPIVHDENKRPLGSGIIWSTGFALGVEVMEEHQHDRIKGLNVMSGYFVRGALKKAGLKMLTFSKKVLTPLEDTFTVTGGKELLEVANFKSDEYYQYYLLSGLTYLGKHGAFEHPDFSEFVPDETPPEKVVKSQKIDVQKLVDAAYCWNSYDRHNSLYVKFGIDPNNVENNLKFYNLCARDITLFDATGAKHIHADTSVDFDFLVKGWIPRGAVTMIGAVGGCGKSSLAHLLAVKASIDYRPDEPKPTWLGAEIMMEKCTGLCIYFAGEDGPAIVHARAKVFDPEGRANRLMFQRTDFAVDGGNIGTFLRNLRKLPDVPLIVIDPARKYLTGDENDAGVVSEFFEAIEEFAVRKRAAMVVVHHLMKAAKPRHILEIYDLLRGSQVFIDRSRVVIGMYREGKHTIVGLSKNNIPPHLGMVQGEHLFLRNPKVLDLIPVPGPEGIRDQDLSDAEIAALTGQ
jgi:hypothetical protein